ncbi:hypothetical protein HZA43_02425 [Candidatus Peregrinibacteria bacterium]|nr:hypothetical protein [Candidatus Peregrinibacteria bacterium]
MSKIIGSFILLAVLLSFPRGSNASYVLPYPSFMPGNKLYRVSRFIDEVKRYWYWGNLSSYRYYLGQSDKALVEAKTLFEYNQYLLAVKALDRSNAALQHVSDSLKGAEFREAMNEHKKVIGKLLGELPEEFIWRPEREKPQTLRIHEELNRALFLRK